MSSCVTIGLKEIREHLRDGRSLRAAAMYALMGPAVILLVSQSSAAERGGFGLLLSMMSVGLLVPFVNLLRSEFDASGASIGLAIALYSLPTALLASLSGSLIDRFGLKRSMTLSAVVAAIASVLACACASRVWGSSAPGRGRRCWRAMA